MPESVFEVLAKLFNFCLVNGYFPKAFKEAKTIPVLKLGKNHSLPNNYRPISMLSVLDKLHRLISHVERNNILIKKTIWI